MKEVVREAVRKEQIVPGKIRVISIFLALIVATVVTTAVVLGDVQRKDRAVQEASGRGSVAVSCSCEQ